jgi:hypothetical protein
VSNGTRIYNIFNQLKVNAQSAGSVLQFCKSTFKCNTVDDLFYIKPYIYGEIEFWKLDKISGGLSEKDVKRLADPLVNYLNDQVFAVGSSSNANANLIPDVIHFHNGQLRSAEKDITKIKEEVEELRQGIQLNIADKPENVNHYVRTFILQNLDRIDLLLNNYDKIRPHYSVLNAYSLFPAVHAFPEVSELVKKLIDNIVDFVNKYPAAVITTMEFVKLKLPQ